MPRTAANGGPSSSFLDSQARNHIEKLLDMLLKLVSNERSPTEPLVGSAKIQVDEDKRTRAALERTGASICTNLLLRLIADDETRTEDPQECYVLGTSPSGTSCEPD